MVVDEFGSTIGIETVHDVLEVVLGECPDISHRKKPQAIRREDGSWLVDAMLETEDLLKEIPELRQSQEMDDSYKTVGGWVMHLFSRIPQEGESVQFQNYTIEVIDMDQNRIDKILLLPSNRTSL